MIDDHVKGFLEPLTAIQRLLEKHHNQGVVIGGIATSLLGKARFTADLDVLILLSIDDISILTKECELVGLYTRMDKAEEFAKTNRVLLLRHKKSGINIDLVLGILPFEVEVVERSTQVSIGEIHVQLPTPEDLIIMKAVAHRTKDIEDINGIIDSIPILDKQRIEYWLKQFSEVLEKPEIWADIKGLLSN
jgi:predicted nucleotidyltransferase